jgi:hypothetical protein
MDEVILYRLTDAHSRYGNSGRAYPKEEWQKFPHYDRPMFEPVNTALTDYELTIISDGPGIQTEYYLEEV